MKYLIKIKGDKKSAHLWNGVDTFCKMYSTGGINKNYVKITDTSENHPVCVMCNKNRKKNRNPIYKINNVQPKIKEQYRKELVNRATMSERVFRHILDRNGIKHEFQKIVRGYIVDFFIEPNYVIEIDGAIHNKKDVIYKDDIRQKNLEKAGFVVIRFSNLDAQDEMIILDALSTLETIR
jgi:very-short-patch-repair endonuclease